jgi:hypothetical protein
LKRVTFKATDFEARDDKTYSVEITANRAGINGGANELTTKTITVTVTDLNGNGKIRLYRYGKFLGSTITCWITNMNLNRITAFYCHINLVLNY